MQQMDDGDTIGFDSLVYPAYKNLTESAVRMALRQAACEERIIDGKDLEDRERKLEIDFSKYAEDVGFLLQVENDQKLLQLDCRSTQQNLRVQQNRRARKTEEIQAS